MDKIWYVLIDGKQNGPFAELAIKTLFNNGRINASTLVWRQGMDNWIPLGAVYALKPILAVTPQIQQQQTPSPSTLAETAPISNNIDTSKKQKEERFCEYCGVKITLLNQAGFEGKSLEGRVSCSKCAMKVVNADYKRKREEIKKKEIELQEERRVKFQEKQNIIQKQKITSPQLSQENDFSKMEIIWYVIIDQKQIGPVTSMALLNIKNNGKIDDNTLVWRQGMLEWLPLKDTELMIVKMPAISTSIPAKPPEEIINEEEEIKCTEDYISFLSHEVEKKQAVEQETADHSVYKEESFNQSDLHKPNEITKEVSLPSFFEDPKFSHLTEIREGSLSLPIFTPSASKDYAFYLCHDSDNSFCLIISHTTGNYIYRKQTIMQIDNLLFKCHLDSTGIEFIWNAFINNRRYRFTFNEGETYSHGSDMTEKEIKEAILKDKILTQEKRYRENKEAEEILARSSKKFHSGCNIGTDTSPIFTLIIPIDYYFYLEPYPSSSNKYNLIIGHTTGKYLFANLVKNQVNGLFIRCHLNDSLIKSIWEEFDAGIKIFTLVEQALFVIEGDEDDEWIRKEMVKTRREIQEKRYEENKERAKIAALGYLAYKEATRDKKK